LPEKYFLRIWGSVPPLPPPSPTPMAAGRLHEEDGGLSRMRGVGPQSLMIHCIARSGCVCVCVRENPAVTAHDAIVCRAHASTEPNTVVSDVFDKTLSQTDQRQPGNVRHSRLTGLNEAFLNCCEINVRRWIT